MIEGGTVYFIRADHIARPVFATNSTGVKVWTATYTPFGGVHTSTGALPPNRFPGQWFQSEPGLHQNWMRDYDPTTGRYIQADPLGLVDGASVYGYALQSPGRWIDPRGEWALVVVPIFEGIKWSTVTAAVALGILASTDTKPKGQTAAPPITPEQCPPEDCAQLIAQIETFATSAQLRLEDMVFDTRNLFTQRQRLRMTTDMLVGKVTKDGTTGSRKNFGI